VRHPLVRRIVAAYDGPNQTPNRGPNPTAGIGRPSGDSAAGGRIFPADDR